MSSSSPPPSTDGLTSALPEEIIIYLTRFLGSRDVLNLSFTCSRLLRSYANDHLWLQFFQRERLKRENSITKVARMELAKAPSDSDAPQSLEKLNYLLHARCRRNWQVGKHTTHSIPANTRVRFGHDSRHLVQLEQYSRAEASPHHKEEGNEERRGSSEWDGNSSAFQIRDMFHVRVWDIGGPGLKVVCEYPNLQIKLQTDFDPDLHTVLVCKGTVILCFSGKGNDTPQELIAFDITNGLFTETWRDAIFEWGQFELPKLFGDGIYKVNLLSSKIEVFEVKSFRKIHTISLVEEMRYPSGDISGDGRYLAIPGKTHPNNSPVISVWNVRRDTQRFLLPDFPVCPFRFFEKTAVKNGLVYGLINRRSLLIWDAESGSCRKRIDLTDEAPGQNDVTISFSFITISRSMISTIHPSYSSAYVFTPLGDYVTTLEPNPATSYRVCEVQINEHALILRTLCVRTPKFQLHCYPLTTQFEADPRPAGGGGARCVSLDLVPVDNQVIYNLGMTPTKVLNFAKDEVRILDFLG